MTMCARFAKRVIDLIGAGVALIVFSPIILILAILLRLRMGAPVFFCQTRPGLRNKPFTIVKFRTMDDSYDDEGNLLPDAQRLTPLGKFLRSTSLDELPELFNVLRGEMSLVGPRPLLMEYLDRYTPQQARRHDVKPGITGWAQVRGRNALDWEEKLTLDTWYADHWNIWLDSKILMLTLIKVLKREGISAAGNATMPRFEGMRKESHG